MLYAKQRGANWWTVYDQMGNAKADVYDTCILDAAEIPILDDAEKTQPLPKLVSVQAI